MKETSQVEEPIIPISVPSNILVNGGILDEIQRQSSRRSIGPEKVVYEDIEANKDSEVQSKEGEGEGGKFFCQTLSFLSELSDFGSF